MKFQKQLHSKKRRTQQWDELAGEWDDIAKGQANGFFQIILQQQQQQQIGTTTTTTKNKNDDTLPMILNPQTIVLDFGCGTGLFTNVIRTHVKQVIAIDISINMLDILQDKILSQEWDNVIVYNAMLGADDDDDNDDNRNTSSQQIQQMYSGKIDMIVASFVLGYLSEDNDNSSAIQSTMTALSCLLKSGGYLYHVDAIPESDLYNSNHSFTQSKAQSYYRMGDLECISTSIVQLPLGHNQFRKAFFGIARKP